MPCTNFFKRRVHAFQMYVMPGPGSMRPAMWFRYDLSPITVKYIEKRKPFYSFITTVRFTLLMNECGTHHELLKLIILPHLIACCCPAICGHK